MEFFIHAKPVFVLLHALAAAVGFGAVVVTDTLFFKFLKDFRISAKEKDVLDTVSRLIWAIIFILFVTGAALYLSAPLDYLAKSKFLVKLCVFAVVVINGCVLNMFISPYLVKLSFNEDAHELIHNPRMRVLRRIAFASGAVSMISWFVVFILGSIRSIPVSFPHGLLYYLALLTIAILGSQLFAMRLTKKRI